MEIMFPEYGNCIANLACSILSYYGVKAPNPTLGQADRLLQKKYKNVVLLLLDGMGSSSLFEHLSPSGFFRQNLKSSFSSTFPPTTVAATTAAMSGLYPNQSAWLGWVGYFPSIDRNVVYYTNKDNDTGEKIEGGSVAFSFVPFEDIFSKIEAAGVHAHWLASWRDPRPKKFETLCQEIEKLCSMEDRRFIYAYWEEPDKSTHKEGVHSQIVSTLLHSLEDTVEQMALHLQDTLLLITADHGLIDSDTIMLSDDQEVMDCLIRRPSMEARALNFFVKEDQKDCFELLFKQRYGKWYQLLPMEEALERQLLGCGENHAQLRQMLGNYLAYATNNVTLRTKDKYFIGEHAGMTADEMMIPLIAFEA